MEHDTFDNESDNDDDDDDGGGTHPPGPQAAQERRRQRPRRSRPPTKESERKKRELITMGKAKGFLTYDEVNEHMPESIVSSDQMDDWLSAFSGEGIEIVDSSSKLKVAEKGGDAEAERRGRGRGRGGGRQEGRGRGGGGRRRLLEDQRPGAHVPAQDGVGLAAHARGRGRDRQAHRGRRAARAAGRAQLVGRDRGDPRARRQAAQAEDPRQGGRQGRRRGGRRVRRAVAHRARLQGHRQGPPALEGAGEGRREAGRQGVSEPTTKKYKKQINDLKQEILDALQEMRLNKKQIDKIVLQAEGVRRAHRAGEPRDHRLRAQVGPDRCKEFRKTLREIRVVAAAPARRRQEARHPPRRDRGDVAGHRRRAEEGQDGRGGGQAHRGRPARHRATRSRTASAWPRRPRPSWSRPTCASWSRSPRSTRTAACSSST